MARSSRRRARRARTYRKKSRKTRRRARGPRRTAPKRSLNVHYYVRSVEGNLSNYQSAPGATIAPCVSSDAGVIDTGTSIGIASPYGTSGGYSTTMRFSAVNTPGFTDFTALYDQYKIRKVKVHFEYSGQGGGDARSDGNPMPRLVLFPDMDDRSAPSYSDIMQREAQTRRMTLDRTRVITHYPKLKSYIEQTPGVSSPSATYKTAWIDVGVPNIEHYGLKLAVIDWPIENYVPGAPSGTYMARPILRVRVEYFFAMRNVR